ncbi:MAG: hypothetical protein ABSE89_00050 [Sedimentisphaerales bacterium]
MKYVIKSTCILFIFVLALGITGCASSTASKSSSEELRLTPLNNKSTIMLSADNVVKMMRQVGFTDEQILELGSRMHDGLLLSGAVQLEIGNKIEAIFAVNENYVYIATRIRGTFIYDVKNNRIISSSQSES